METSSSNLAGGIFQTEWGLLQHKVPPFKFDNLTRDENKTLKSLSLNKAIVIKNADKGGAVVVLNTTDYIKEGLRQLSDPNFYSDTPTDLTHTNTEYINAYINANIDYALPHLWAWTYLTDLSNVNFIHIYPPEVQNL